VSSTSNGSRLMSVLVYLAVCLLALSAAARLKAHAQDQTQAQPAQAGQTITPKPYFELSTNHTYGTDDRARVWINYQGIDHLDFRIYSVKDPVKFFAGLNNPHQVGEREKTEVASNYQEKPSALEKVRSFKVSVFKSIKNYFRAQLRPESRETLSQKFVAGAGRVPLNVADYARVPLLNVDQLVESWRQTLPALENDYDSRMVMIGKRDPGIYLIEGVNNDLRAYTIAIVTDLAMITKTSPDGGILVYAVDRKSGTPRQNVQVETIKGMKRLASGTTDSSGIFKAQIQIERPKVQPEEHPEDYDPEKEQSQVGRNDYLTMASYNDHFAISDLEPSYFGGGGGAEEGDEGGGGTELLGYCYTDRPVYRPGQKVYFKAILRKVGEAGYEMIGGRSVNVVIEDPNSAKILDKSFPLSAKGTINGDLDIANGAPLGGYSITVHMPDREAAVTTGNFEVEEYKKPEYKVTVSTPKQFVQVGQKTTFSIEARYFFGSPVTNADVKYYIYRSSYYQWWWAGDDADDLGDNGQSAGEDSDEGGGYYGYGTDMVKDGDGKVDANGKLQVEFEVPEPDAKGPGDFQYRLEAQVTDASRRMIEGAASFVGTRGSVVSNVTTDKYVYYQDDNAKVRVMTSDYQGHPVSAKVTLKFVHRVWVVTYKDDTEGKSKQVAESKLREDALSSAEVTTDSQGQATYDYTVPVVGSIEINAFVSDGGKEIQSNGGWLWAADKQDRWADFSYEENTIKLVPDKKSYQPGDTAHVLAMLPVEKADILVTTELATVMTSRTVKAAGRAVVIDVPIEQRYTPNAFLALAFVKDGEMFSQDISLSVPARNKFLKLDIITDKTQYKPQDKAGYTILARNQDGSPAAGVELSLGLVDESIYSIRPDQSGDIRKAFYGHRYNQVQDNLSISYEFSGFSSDKKPINLARNRASFELADFKNDAQYQEPTIRKDFKDTAFWQPEAVTGADGKATMTIPLPDNLTTWRATVRGITADTRVGSGLARVICRKDLIMRLETPRFLSKGDTATLSGIVHNYLDSDKVTQVSIQVTGARLLDPASQTITIAKQGEQRIDWRVAADQVGDVKLLASAKTDAESDAVELPLQIVPAGLRHTTGGVTAISDDSADKSLSLDIPANVDPQSSALRIGVTPSIAGSIFGALDYLTSFPYGCTEQTMSSFLPNVVVTQALKDVNTASIRSGNDLGAKVQRGLDRLYDYQHPDGGWGWWKTDKTDPFMTAYVVDGLAMAARAGYKVDAGRIGSGRGKLKQMIASDKRDDGKPIDLESRAYMIYAMAVSGDSDSQPLNDLFAKRGQLQPYGKALLALTLQARHDEGRARQVAGEIESTAHANDFDAHWESTRKPMVDFSERDDIEATALSLKALVQITPASPLLPKAAKWLVGNRRFGYYWDSTRQTAFAILGLIDYIKVSKELSPDYSVEVYLNGDRVMTGHMTQTEAKAGTGQVIQRKGADVRGSNQIRIVKHGAGALYVSTTLEYFSKEEDTSAQASPDLTLTREYLRLKVTENGEKASWSIEPLTGEVRSGDLIVVRLRVKGASAQYMMIEDPIPAGCEQVENVSGINLDYSEGHWCDWYSNREFRDQKTVLFVDYFPGNDTFQYALRVQVPGQFRAGPARAELMYAPTVESNTAPTAMTILDKK
jgi:uncharacterized protein YfaS (alpha-2-macroglobulin family)